MVGKVNDRLADERLVNFVRGEKKKKIVIIINTKGPTFLHLEKQ